MRCRTYVVAAAPPHVIVEGRTHKFRTFPSDPTDAVTEPRDERGESPAGHADQFSTSARIPSVAPRRTLSVPLSRPH